jgi:hypothetical protein
VPSGLIRGQNNGLGLKIMRKRADFRGVIGPMGNGKADGAVVFGRTESNQFILVGLAVSFMQMALNE